MLYMCRVLRDGRLMFNLFNNRNFLLFSSYIGFLWTAWLMCNYFNNMNFLLWCTCIGFLRGGKLMWNCSNKLNLLLRCSYIVFLETEHWCAIFPLGCISYAVHLSGCYVRKTDVQLFHLHKFAMIFFIFGMEDIYAFVLITWISYYAVQSSGS